MAIQAFPPYLVGPNLSGCIITGATLGVTGIITLATGAGNTGNLATTGVMDDVSFEKTRSLAQIQPINAVLDNFVPIAAGFTCNVGEIRKADGTSILDAISSNFTYAQVIVNTTPPGGTASYTDAIIGVIESVRKDYVQEKNGIVMVLRPIGIVTYSGTYTTTPYA
jgi:hypothetical protein